MPLCCRVRISFKEIWFGLTLQPVSPPGRVSYRSLRVQKSWGPCRPPWWRTCLGQPPPSKKVQETEEYSEYLVNAGKWQPVQAARLLPARSDMDAAAGWVSARAGSVWSPPMAALGHLGPCYRHRSHRHAAEVWNTGSRCNIRTEEAVFCQLIVTKIKSFLLCSSLAFLPGKQKNVHREESCNKLSPQLQKQWPTQANFPATQSWYLRLFNQRWEKARGCGVGFFPKESTSAASRMGLSFDSSVYLQTQGMNCLIICEGCGNHVMPDSPASYFKRKTKND